MHQMVLDGFGEIEGNKDPAFAHLQFAQRAHLPDSHLRPPKGQQFENATRLVGFQYTAKMPRAAITVLGDVRVEQSHELTSTKGNQEGDFWPGILQPSLAPGGPSAHFIGTLVKF
jgi:hypothetical protein